LIVVGSLALLTWFGLERVQTRLGTLFQDQVFKDGRVSLLSRAPPLVQQFPLWGAGFGSLDFVEPMHRTDATDAGWSYQHAHNEYLESLIEGGLVGLVLTVLVVGLVLRLGLRAFRRLEGIPTQGLVLGLLFGFATLALHSIVDFGIHVPAIALLATVICAHLSALSNGEPAPARVGPGPESVSTPWSTLLTRWLVALLGIVALVCVALFLLAEGYRGASVSRLLDGALALKGAVELPDQKARLAVLEEASDLDPANPRLHFEVGEKHAAVYDALKQKQLDQEALLDGIQALALLNPGCAPAQGSNGGLGLLFVAKVHQERRKRVMLDLERRHLAPALHHLLQARDLCPTRAKPHLEIAAYAELMKKADSRRTYIDRALFLDPTNPDFWYRAGILEARDLHPDQAARDWRRSLELSDVFLKKILARTARLSSQDLMDHVLPEDPYIHIASALHLFPTPDDPRRLPFFNKARRLYETLPGPWRAEDLHQKAFVLASLNHPKEAAATYREALAQKPLVLEWRLDLARLLYQQEKFLEAQQELRTILAVQPRNGEAQDLLRRTEREIGKNRGR
jgi:tetratricopeptide (TPR) repeat protein